MTASADQTVRVWDAIVQYEEASAKPEERAAKRILQGHSGIVNCLLWSGMICFLSLESIGWLQLISHLFVRWLCLVWLSGPNGKAVERADGELYPDALGPYRKHYGSRGMTLTCELVKFKTWMLGIEGGDIYRRFGR